MYTIKVIVAAPSPFEYATRKKHRGIILSNRRGAYTHTQRSYSLSIRNRMQSVKGWLESRHLFTSILELRSSSVRDPDIPPPPIFSSDISHLRQPPPLGIPIPVYHGLYGPGLDCVGLFVITLMHTGAVDGGGLKGRTIPSQSGLAQTGPQMKFLVI